VRIASEGIGSTVASDAELIAATLSLVVVIGVGAVVLGTGGEHRRPPSATVVGGHGPRVLRNLAPASVPRLAGQIVCNADLARPGAIPGLGGSPNGVVVVSAAVIHGINEAPFSISASGLAPLAGAQIYAVWLSPAVRGISGSYTVLKPPEPRLLGVVAPGVGPDGKFAVTGVLPAADVNGTYLVQITRQPRSALQAPGHAVLAVGPGPQSAAENAATQTLYVANAGDNTVSVVDLRACSSGNLAGCAQSAPVVHVGDLPLGVAVDESTNTIYVANAVNDTVSVINGAACDALDVSGCAYRPITVTVGAFDNAVAVDPLTHMVFVTNQNANPGSVSGIDGNACTGTHPGGCAGQPLSTVQVGGGASGLGVNSATNTIYVANTGEDSNSNPVPEGNAVSVIDGATCRPAHPTGCAVVGTVAVGIAPVAIAADSATNTVYVANTYDGAVHQGTVSVVDGAHCDAGDPTGGAAQTPPQVTVGHDPIGVAVEDHAHVVFVANNGPRAAALAP
jgi:DNA-binding beta-propeller fold protein YncE